MLADFIETIVNSTAKLALFALVLSGCNHNTVNSSKTPDLAELDKLIIASPKYESIRLERIDSCRNALSDAVTAELRYPLYSELWSLFDKYQTDSSMKYASLSIKCAELLEDNEKLAVSKSASAKANATAGMYYEAIEILNGIDRHGISEDTLGKIYRYYIFIYESLASLSLDKELSVKYYSIAKQYSDSLINIDSDNSVYVCDKLISEGNYKAALDYMIPKYEELSPVDIKMGPVAIAIADIYHILGWREAEKSYLISSAISDLTNAKKEYVALRSLGLMLYEDGDITRAYTYLKRSLDDATFCKARLKVDLVAPLLSIVNEAYVIERKKDMKIVLFSLLVVCVLLLSLSAVIIHLRHQNVKLTATRNELSKAKADEEKVYRSLREASNIKNTYVTSLMLECISRIEKLEQFRAGIKRKALLGDLSSLQKELKSTDYVEKEWESFYNVFDRTFLSLFPSFISDFNKLLKADCQLSQNLPNELTQEMRTFALIRLGIDNTDRIAELLRYSRSTIYAYRSKARSNALSPETFDTDIMHIQSI